MTPEVRRALVIDGFATYFGERARSEVLEYVEQDWAGEEWIRGGYGAHLGTGVWTQYGSLLREPEGRIHWAGAETSAVWNGYMDGAVRSGERVAAEIAASLGAPRRLRAVVLERCRSRGRRGRGRSRRG